MRNLGNRRSEKDRKYMLCYKKKNKFYFELLSLEIKLILIASACSMLGLYVGKANL